MKKLPIKDACAQIVKVYKSLVGVIIYITSLSYAFGVCKNIYGELIFSSLIIFVFFGFVGAILNYVLYRRFSKEYHVWGNKEVKESSLGVKAMLVPFIPPVSTFLMSSALSLYIVRLFSEYYKKIWDINSILLPNVLEGFFVNFLFGFVIFIISFALMVISTYLVSKVFKGDGSGILVLLYLLTIVGSGVLYWFSFENELVVSITEKSLYFLIGFIPVHWFYFLFVSPFRKQKS